MQLFKTNLNMVIGTMSQRIQFLIKKHQFISNDFTTIFACFNNQHIHTLRIMVHYVPK